MCAPWQRHGWSADSREVSQLVLSRTVEKERDAVVLLMKHNDHDSTYRPEWTVGRKSLITKLGDAGSTSSPLGPRPRPSNNCGGMLTITVAQLKISGTERPASLERKPACSARSSSWITSLGEGPARGMALARRRLEGRLHHSAIEL